jgi:hypothetical protein
MRTWGTLVLITGLSVFLGTAPTTRATEGPERVFEPVDVGATMLTGAAYFHRPKAVYVADSIRAARKFKPFVSAATWNKVLQVDFRHDVAVATFVDISCPMRFHIVDIARVRLRLMVFGEAIYARPGTGVGCTTSFPPPLSYEVIRVPRAVVGLPLPRANSLTIDFRQQPQCEVPERWWLVVRFDPHDQAANVARLDAAVAAAKRHGLTIVSVLYGLVFVYVEGDATAVAQTQSEDPDIEHVSVDPGDPWACLGLFP